MNRKLFPKVYAALNFSFFCFKTKDNERRKKGLIEVLKLTSVYKFIFLKFYTLVASLRESSKIFITYILSNTRFLIRAKRLAFILALASVG